MKMTIRVTAFLLALVMMFTLVGCASLVKDPTSIPTTGSAPASTPTSTPKDRYTAEEVSALIAELEADTSTTVGKYTSAMDVITTDFEAKPGGTDTDEFQQMTSALMQTRDARLAALESLITALRGIDLKDTDTVAAKIAEAQALLSDDNHTYGEMIHHSRNTESTPCTDTDHYQICTQCNAINWSKGEHQWYYSRNMEDHQKCCRVCDAAEEVAQHDKNDQGICNTCNYKLEANILIIESIAGESDTLAGMIDTGHTLTVVHVADSTKMPTSIDELKAYDEVILVNVANRDMPKGFDLLLQKYVQDFGGGLLTIGGNTADSTEENWKANAYDKDDLQDTIYQDMLPVDIRDSTVSVGVIFIIDRSGSMWNQGGGQPYEKSMLYAAKLGAEACLGQLQDDDYVGILPLGDYYKDYPELFPISQKNKILTEIDSIELGGGTIFEGALATARQALLANTQVQRRHIILITDGMPGDMDPCDYLDQAEMNAQAGITMSVVGTGCDNFAKREMKTLLKAGGGEEKHFYDAADATSVSALTLEALRLPELRKVVYADYTPSVAVVILVDVSGSMWPGTGDADYPYEQSKLYYAVAAAKASLDALGANDYVGVVALSDYYLDGISLTPCTQHDKILSAINSLKDAAGGGTVFSAGLMRAGRLLAAQTDVERRHIILITDGEPSDQDTEQYKYWMQQNAEAGITHSIIGIQTTATAAANMKNLLVEFGGMAEKNFYDVSDLQSTVKAMQEDLSIPAFNEIRYAPFQPILHAFAPITQGIAQADIPMLSDFYYSRAKAGATIILSKDSAPIYAQWRYGKGSVGSFMCDLNGTWSSEFIDSEEGAEIINRIISSLANPPEETE